jgi:4-hydroxy-2-oxoglutarate aldolase
MELRGVFAPVTTPFDPVTGDADVVSMRANLRAWLRTPLAGVVLFGSTGEGPILDEDEKTRLTAATRNMIDGDRLLLAGTGTESTRATIRQTKAVAAEGADAVLVQPPSYYKPMMTPDALRDHYVAVADESPVPVILYQVPPRFSTVELSAGLVGELARHPNIVGIKDSHGDLKSLGALVEACDGRAAVLVGSGAMLYGALEAGAVGGILAVSLLLPAESAAVYTAFMEGRLAEAGRMQERISPLHRAVVAEMGAPGVKMAMDEIGMHGGPTRAPLKPLREKDRAKVREALQQAGLLTAEAAAD